MCGRRRFTPWVRKIPWRRKWQPTPVFLCWKSHGQRSLMGYSLWGRRGVGHDLQTKQQPQLTHHMSQNFRHLEQTLKVLEILWAPGGARTSERNVFNSCYAISEAYEVKRKCQQKGKLLPSCPFKTHLPLSSITPLRSTQPAGGCGLSDPNRTAKAGKVSSDSTPGC